MSTIIKRKLAAAMVSSVLYASLFLFFGMEGIIDFFYLGFIFLITYGVIASLISDGISRSIPDTARTKEWLSFFFHCFFGLLFREFSLVAAILFFGTDRFLKRYSIKWVTVLIPFVILLIGFIFVIRNS